MCGRAKLDGDVSELKIRFSIPPEYPAPNFPPSYNVAPTDNLPIVRYDAKAGHRTLDLMRWGLVPYWAKDIKIDFSTINEMAETVASKPVFREAFQRRRCLVPVDNFYEWQKIGKESQPPSRSPIAASWPWLAYEKRGAPRPRRRYTASRSSRPSPMTYAPGCITGCRSFSTRLPGPCVSARKQPGPPN